MRAHLGLALALVSAGMGLSQRLDSLSAQGAVESTLADLRGLGEVFITPNHERPPDAHVLWPLMTYDAAFATLPSPSPGSDLIVSVRQLRDKVPKAAKKAYQRASKFAQANHVERAMEELERAIALDPQYGEAHAVLGVQYARLGRYREAELELRRTIELIPRDEMTYANLAWVQWQVGNLAGAEQSLRSVLQITPGNASASLLLGVVLVAVPETEAEGRLHLESAARTLPEAKRILLQLNGILPSR